jgi:hypothetical protein
MASAFLSRSLQSQQALHASWFCPAGQEAESFGRQDTAVGLLGQLPGLPVRMTNCWSVIGQFFQLVGRFSGAGCGTLLDDASLAEVMVGRYFFRHGTDAGLQANFNASSILIFFLNHFPFLRTSRSVFSKTQHLSLSAPTSHFPSHFYNFLTHHQPSKWASAKVGFAIPVSLCASSTSALARGSREMI